MNCTDLINIKLQSFKHPRYIEIGVRNGETFFSVNARKKWGVDPSFFSILRGTPSPICKRPPSCPHIWMQPALRKFCQFQLLLTLFDRECLGLGHLGSSMAEFRSANGKLEQCSARWNSQPVVPHWKGTQRHPFHVRPTLPKRRSVGLVLPMDLRLLESKRSLCCSP